MMTTLAAGTGATILGGLGTGGVALVLTTALVLGTRTAAEKTFKKSVALFIGLAAGTVWMGAGQVWGMPDDLVLNALKSAGVGSGDGPLGDVEMTAIAVVLVLVAYLWKLKPRTAGVTGIIMATVFASAGGGWSMMSGAIGDFFVGFAS